MSFFFVLKLFGVPSMSVISVLVIKHMPEMSSVFCMEMCLRFVIMAVMFRADGRDELKCYSCAGEGKLVS